MQCDYFDAGVCRSCVHLATPYDEQLARKADRVRALLDRPRLVWEPPFASREGGFRSKAKMIVGGTPDAPTFGILDPAAGQGVDLRECRLLGPATATAMPILADLVARVGMRPYDVPRRTGELKGVQVVEDRADTGGTGALMVRFVLRSEGQLGKLRAAVPALLADLPALRVVTANLLPEHKAVAEGDVEVVLTREDTLPLRVGDIVLHVHPGAFVQTNTEVAGGLYRQAARWVGERDPATVLDLYCGVGGFALHAARASGDDGAAEWGACPAARGRQVHGVEVSEAAVAGARRGAAEAGLAATFEAGDATAALAERAGRGEPAPDLLIVNPPRRGLGPRLAASIETCGSPAVLYSSCNPTTLARDLAAMPSLRPVRARLFDMFPHTDHAEVLTLLVRS